MRYTHRLCEDTWAQVASGPPTDSRRIVKAFIRDEARAVDNPGSRQPALAGLAQVPMRLIETDPPRPERRGWVSSRPVMTGICGSDAKQVFMDFGEGLADSALNGLFSFPTVLGHEVVADVVEIGAGYRGPADRDPGRAESVALLCAEGHRPACGSCETGDYEPLLALHRR